MNRKEIIGKNLGMFRQDVLNGHVEEEIDLGTLDDAIRFVRNAQGLYTIEVVDALREHAEEAEDLDMDFDVILTRTLIADIAESVIF